MALLGARALAGCRTVASDAAFLGAASAPLNDLCGNGAGLTPAAVWPAEDATTQWHGSNSVFFAATPSKMALKTLLDNGGLAIIADLNDTKALGLYGDLLPTITSEKIGEISMPSLIVGRDTSGVIRLLAGPRAELQQHIPDMLQHLSHAGSLRPVWLDVPKAANATAGDGAPAQPTQTGSVTIDGEELTADDLLGE